MIHCFFRLQSQFEQALGECVKDITILDSTWPLFTEDRQNLRAALSRFNNFVREKFTISPDAIDECETGHEA
jgi:hypothetical protein